MNKNLLWKSLLIVGILLVFLFGIFGVPKSLSGQGLLSSITDRIHLGLDLRGGTHLILQVQVNDAVKVDADNAVEVLKEQLNKRKIAFSAEQSRPDRDQGRPPCFAARSAQHRAGAPTRVQRCLGCRQFFPGGDEATNARRLEEQSGGTGD